MKTVAISILLVCLLMLSAQAGTIGLGAGMNGGLEFPIVQKDQKQGSVFGFKALIKLSPVVILEPCLSLINYGNPEFEEFTSDLEGSKVTAYSLNAILGKSFGDVGINPYGLFGIGYYNTSNDQTGAESKNTGWSAGFGVEIGVSTRVGLDFRGRVAVISTDGGGTKKSGAMTAGINFYFSK